MIEEIMGADAGPSRRGHVRAVSALLIVLAVVGYAAASSTVFQGPFATPDPNQRALELIASTQPPTSKDGLSFMSIPASCWQMQQTRIGVGLVNGRPVTIERPMPTPPPGVETIFVVTANGTSSMWSRCGPADAPISPDRSWPSDLPSP